MTKLIGWVRKMWRYLHRASTPFVPASPAPFAINPHVHIIYPPELLMEAGTMTDYNPQAWGRKLFTIDEMKELPPVAILARCLYGESRGSPREAKVAVAWAVHNRVYHWHGGKPEAWAKVILQPLQFSWTIEDKPWTPNVVDPDINMGKVLDPMTYGPWSAWEECCKVASGVFNGDIPDPTKTADHYYDKSMDANPPKWAKKMTPTVSVGRFRFFKSDRIPV